MEPIYHFEYTETEKTFQDMYLMFYQSRSGYGYKLTIFFMGLLILFMQVSPDPSILTPKYIIQAAVIWALAFLLGFLGNKYIPDSTGKTQSKAGRRPIRRGLKNGGQNCMYRSTVMRRSLWSPSRRSRSSIHTMRLPG